MHQQVQWKDLKEMGISEVSSIAGSLGAGAIYCSLDLSEEANQNFSLLHFTQYSSSNSNGRSIKIWH